MRIRRAAAIAVGLTTLTPVAAQAASPKHDSVESSVIRKLNAMRAQHGVRRVRSSRGLGRAADAKSAAIAFTGDFSHGNMSARVRRFVRAGSVGETLAWVPPTDPSPAQTVVDAWMASASHRATLLSGRFARIGVARRTGSVGGSRAVVFTVDLASAR